MQPHANEALLLAWSVLFGIMMQKSYTSPALYVLSNFAAQMEQ